MFCLIIDKTKRHRNYWNTYTVVNFLLTNSEGDTLGDSIFNLKSFQFSSGKSWKIYNFRAVSGDKLHATLQYRFSTAELSQKLSLQVQDLQIELIISPPWFSTEIFTTRTQPKTHA